MSFTFIGQSSENFEFRSSVWNWKAALEIIKSFDVISEGKIRQMSYNATGVSVSQIEAQSIAEGIAQKILPALKPGYRMYGDLSVSQATDDGTLYRDEGEQWKNYSVDHEWLTEFTEFCLKCKGFQIF